MKPVPPISARERIIKYVRSHPGCTRTDIKAFAGVSDSYLGEILARVFPELVGPRQTTQHQRVLEFDAANPGVPQREVAKILGVARSTVSLAICGAYGILPRNTPEHYNKPAPAPYKLLPCPFCEKDHKSTWAGDRYHPWCRKRIGESSENMSEYEFTTGRKTRGGPT